MSWLDSIWKEKTKDWMIGPLPPSNTPDNIPQAPLQAEEQYVSIELKSLRIVNVRRGWSRFYGVVHSRVALSDLGESGRAEFNSVTVPPFLKDIDPSGLDRVILMNIPLGGPIPYRGGPLEMQIGLFSVKSKDLAGPFIDLLQDLSHQAGVAFVSQALPFIGPIKKGVEMLTGTGEDVEPLVGVDRQDDPPGTGWFAVIAEDKQSSRLRLADLKVDPSDMRLLDASGRPVQDVAYFLYVVRASKERHDWHQIPELRRLYQQLRDDIRKNNINEAKQTLGALRRYLLTSADLIQDDADRIFKLVEKRAQNAIPTATPTAFRGGLDIGELAHLPVYKNL